MKKYLFLVVAIVIQACCTDRGSEYYPLSEFEKNLIPFTDATTQRYQDGLGNEYNAQISPKVFDDFNLRAGNDESCASLVTEMIYNTFTISELGLNLEALISTQTHGLEFYIIEDRRYILGPDNCTGVVASITDLSTSIELHNKTYTDVFVLSPCFDNVEIERLIYSPIYGIELIEFTDGTFLQRID